ncbi:C1 family peptidase [Aquimarina sediminis]|uniref:C1 family peptidase n=1 Tax=Aquimarina sediminis TaxID=2070536 RepID=UPI000CA00A10|nr:C1 family peptidase [Aquimarina sediminis]
MKKTTKLFLLIGIVLTQSLYSQYNGDYQTIKERPLKKELPCEFSWAAVRTATGMRNFTSAHREQPFQGPCLSFAFNAAIETTYMIEYDQMSPLKLSDAYLDMKVFSEDMNAYKTVLESGFEIPKHIPGSFEYMPSTFLPGVDSWFDTAYNSFRLKAMNCINDGRNFVVSAIDEPPTTYEVLDTCGDFVTEDDYLSVDDVIAIPMDIIPTVKDLKEIIIEKGPVVIKVNNEKIGSEYTLQKFKNYTTPSIETLSYHAFTLIGWEDGPGDTTKWIVKDSWLSAGAVSNMMSDTEFIDLLTSETIELYRVENVVKNDTLPNVSTFTVDYDLQCAPVPQPFFLMSIGVELHYAWIGGKLYSKFFVHSNIEADEWEWSILTPSYTTSEIHGSTHSSILLSPHESGYVSLKVRARKDGVWTPWKHKTIYVANGSSGGMY